MIAWSNNPDGCACPSRLAEHGGDCNACYFSQVNERNQWVGSQRCWDAQCLVLDAEHSDTLHTQYLHVSQQSTERN